MTETTDIKIIDRVRKLLSLSTSSNVNEAQNAMLKAQELMIKNGLSMTDVSEIKDKKVIDSSTDRVGRFPWYAYTLADVIADNFRCYSITSSNKKTRRIQFIGLENDANAAIEVYNFAYFYLKEQIKYYKKEFIDNDGFVNKRALNSYGNDFARGFIEGLNDKFKKQVEDQEWGLIMIKDEAVIKHYDDMKVKSGGRCSVSSSGSEKAWMAGYVVGKDFEMIVGSIE
jgi:hypothetical protein